MEVVCDVISGYVCESLDEMADYAGDIQTLIRPSAGEYAARHFATERMAAEYLQLYEQICEVASPKIFKEHQTRKVRQRQQHEQLGPAA